MTFTSPLGDDARRIVSEALQDALADLIGLGLLSKQAHWNLVGPSFLTLHRQLDEVADAAREQSDVIADRAVTIGGVPDGRAATVAASDNLPTVPLGPLGGSRHDDEARHNRRPVGAEVPLFPLPPSPVVAITLHQGAARTGMREVHLSK